MLINLLYCGERSGARHATTTEGHPVVDPFLRSRGAGMVVRGPWRKPRTPPARESLHERFDYFLADGGFKSEILMQNLGLKKALTGPACPSLALENRKGALE